MDINTEQEYYLGAVPERITEAYENAPTFEQWQIENGNLYLSIAWYEGTGHFFAEQSFVTAKLNKESSVDRVEAISVEYSEGIDSSQAFVVKNGKMMKAQGIPYKGFCNSETGDYGYYDADGNAVANGTGYGTVYDENYATQFDCECAELVGDRIFLVNNNLVRDEAEDIGWREAYVRSYTSIFVEKVGNDDGANIINYINPDYINED